MFCRERLNAALLLASIVIGASTTHAQSATSQPAASPAAVVANRSMAEPQREEAARQLLLQKSAQSRQSLVQILEDASDPQGQLAVARAISSGIDPANEFLVPLRLLMGTDRALTDAAAQAIAGYKGDPESLRLLVNFASARQQREADRILAIRAISLTSQKSAAEFLVSLLMREDDTQRIRNAAADALVDMTGRFENGQDPRLWRTWWAENAGKSEAQWQKELMAFQASRYAQTRQQYDQLTNELQSILTRVYEGTAPAQQSMLLLTYLRSANPEIRRIGALIVNSEAMAAHPIPPEAREQLRNMVGDSSREVRLAVANAMLAANDPAALDALIAQLQKEPDPGVRAALAAPIASAGEMRAVPVLRALLKDPSPATAAAGAAALRELGQVIREKDPQLARDIARDLRDGLARRPAESGTLPLRESFVEALVPLRDPEMMPTFYQLLRDNGSARIRWAALRGMGELRDPKAADTIARYLEDRESGVRLEAVRSLGKTAAAEHAEELYRRMNPVEETDAMVREEAWNVLQTTFATLPLDQLPAWIQRFNGDAARRVIAISALIARQDAQQHPPMIAANRQALGKALMELGQSGEAASQFRQALAYYRAQSAQEMVVEQLVEQYLQALLRSRAYADASQFGSSLLAQRTSYQQTVGVLFRNEARLLMEQKRYADAIAVSDAAQKITPAVAARYMEEITNLVRPARAATPGTQPSTEQ